MIKIAVIEDEQEIQESIHSFINQYMAENSLSYQAKTFLSAESFLFSPVNEYDIIFMDINLPGLNGFETCLKLREKNVTSIIIFVTSLAQYAIKGYEVNAFDFIVKPLNYYSFALKLRRAINEIKRNIIDTLVIKNKTQLNVININDIYYVEVTSHTVTYHTKNGEFKSTGTMRQIEEKLSPFHFALCNQCYLVNLRYITSIEGSSLKVGPYELIISRPRRKEFMMNLNLYIAGHLGK